MHTSHVVTEIPVAWEPIARDSTFTAIVGTQKRLIAIHMYGMCLALVTQEACSG